MTSSRSCYVYLQLPGTLDVVTCGRYERDVTREGGSIGRFVYGRTFRERTDAVPLDPYHLPLEARRFETAKLDGMFGALRDASPDSWGRRIIERRTGRVDLDELDYLLEGPEDGAGALTFGVDPRPRQRTRRYNGVLRLRELRDAALLLEEAAPGAPVPEQISDLIDPGTSIGGARPKNVVEDDNGLWIAKFPQASDKWTNAAVEGGMLTLAARCGIRTPPIRIEKVGNEAVLLVKRFDRERVDGGYHRHRMVSALTVLDAEDHATARTDWSYLLLADELRRWSERAVADRAEMFRRIAFNALISNQDDHPRNHALIAPGRDWRLAPAYDLTPRPSTALERRDLALECGPLGRMARRDNLVAGAPRFGIERAEAHTIVDDLKAIVTSHWREDVRAHGATVDECNLIASAFAYEGFEYETRG